MNLTLSTLLNTSSIFVGQTKHLNNMHLFPAFSALVLYTKIFGLAPNSGQHSIIHMVYNFVAIFVSSITIIYVKFGIYFRVLNIFFIFQAFLDIFPIICASVGSTFFMMVSYKKSLLILEMLSKASIFTNFQTNCNQSKVKRRLFISSTPLMLVSLVLYTFAFYVIAANDNGFRFIIMGICYYFYGHQNLLVAIWYTNLCYLLKDQFLYLEGEISNLGYIKMINSTKLTKRRCSEKIQSHRQTHSALVMIVKELNSAYGLPMLTHALDLFQSTMFTSLTIILSISKLSIEPNRFYDIMFYTVTIFGNAARVIFVLHASSGVSEQVSNFYSSNTPFNR